MKYELRGDNFRLAISSITFYSKIYAGTVEDLDL
jgi:hypothetical protein